MSRDGFISDENGGTEPEDDRLDSWKEIAAYLKRDVRTVHRWEADQGLPVRRHLHKKKSTVFAYRSELDAWWTTRPPQPETSTEKHDLIASPALSRGRSRLLVALALILCAVVVVVALTARHRSSPTRSVSMGRLKLVVLPFENLSGDPEQEFFSDGLTDELTTELANLSPERLAVIARTSAIRYKHHETSIEEIARTLGVDYVLESSVRRVNERVMVTERLIQASDQTNVWVQTYERDISKLPALQSEIAQAISKEITLPLTPDQQARIASAQQVNPSAWEAYMMGLFFFGKFTVAGMNKSIDYFQQAIDKEPRYARAYSRMARAYGVLGHFGALRPEQAYPQASRAALRALEIDPYLEEAYCQLGWTKLFYDRDWAGAKQNFERAVSLSPNSATAHQAYAGYFISMGDFDDAFTEILKAQELDPVSLNIKTDIGWYLYLARRNDESIAKLNEVIQMDPNFAITHVFLADAYKQKGMFSEAIAEAEKSAELVNPDQSLTRIALLGHAYAVAGKTQQAQRVLAKLKTLSRDQYLPPYHVALVYAALGQKDEAFEWLETAFQDRQWMMAFLKVDPRWDTIRSDPRFDKLLKRTGLST